jgi:tetratricopeptide (TPR) repeat protein
MSDPVRVFLSHASANKLLIEDVKRILEDGGDIRCWLDSYEIGFGQNIVSRINEGLANSDFVLFFLSPESLKSRWVEEEWSTAYWSQVNSGNTRLIPVLIGDSQPPPILANKKYVDLRTNQLEQLRDLRSQLLRGRTVIAPPTKRASLPHFVGREAELEELKQRLWQTGSLVPIVGMPGVGKTYLAREFIRRHGSFFEQVIELNCEGKDLAALTGELSTMLNLRPEGDATQVAAELRGYIGLKRCLLLLDNVEDDQPGQLVPLTGRASVLVTSRIPSIPFFADEESITPRLFTEPECLTLFRSVLGTFPEELALKLFGKFGYLPIAVAVSAGLIRHDPRYTVQSLERELPLDLLAHGRNNVGLLLRKAIAALDAQDRELLTAMAACAAGGFKLDLAAEIAELSEADALYALKEIFARSLVVEVDRDVRHYRLHPLIREAAAPGSDVRARHAGAVLQRLEHWKAHPLRAALILEEASQALASSAPGYSAALIALYAGNVGKVVGRLSEAWEFYEALRKLAADTSNQDWLQASYGNQALILQAWGRLDEAMALLKKQEAICEELGDRAGLARSFWGQGLILRERDEPDKGNKKLQSAFEILAEVGMIRERDAVRRILDGGA